MALVLAHVTVTDVGFGLGLFVLGLVLGAVLRASRERGTERDS